MTSILVTGRSQALRHLAEACNRFQHRTVQVGEGSAQGDRHHRAVLYPMFAKPVSMKQQTEDGQLYRNYPHALTDVKFQPAYRPSGRFAEQKTYFSAKHKLYGFKFECSVAPPGLADDMSSHRPGSALDLTIMLDRVKVHRKMLRKASDDPIDEVTTNVEFALLWAVLLDKGYQCAHHLLRVLRPKEKPQGGLYG